MPLPNIATHRQEPEWHRLEDLIGYVEECRTRLRLARLTLQDALADGRRDGENTAAPLPRLA